MAQDLVVIVLPMYNAEPSIPLLQEVFAQDIEMPPGFEYRIIVVNDGSQDRTLELINKWRQENHRVLVLSHARNMGAGQAILTGFGEAIRMSSSCLITLSADTPHPGETIKRMVNEIKKGADIVIASRFAPGSKQIGFPLLRKTYSLGIRLLLSLFFPLKGIRDYTGCIRAYRATMVNQALSQTETSFLSFSNSVASAEILLKFVIFATKVVEVPVILKNNHKNSLKKFTASHIIRDYYKLVKLPKQKCALGVGLTINQDIEEQSFSI